MKNLFNIQSTYQDVNFAQIKYEQKTIKKPFQWIAKIYPELTFKKSKKYVSTNQSTWITGWSGSSSIFRDIYLEIASKKNLTIMIVNDWHFSPALDDSQPMAVLGQQCSINFFNDVIDNYDFKKIFFPPLSLKYPDFDLTTNLITQDLINRRKNQENIDSQIVELVYETHIINAELKNELLEFLIEFKNIQSHHFIDSFSNLTIKELIEQNFSIFIDFHEKTKRHSYINNVFIKLIDEILTQLKKTDYHFLAQTELFAHELFDLQNKHILHVPTFHHEFDLNYPKPMPKEIQIVLCHVEDSSDTFLHYIKNLLPGYTKIKRIPRKSIIPQNYSTEDYIQVIRSYHNHEGYIINQLTKEMSFFEFLNIRIYPVPIASFDEVEKNYKKYLYQLMPLKEKIMIENQWSMSATTNDSQEKPKKVKI